MRQLGQWHSKGGTSVQKANIQQPDRQVAQHSLLILSAAGDKGIRLKRQTKLLRSLLPRQHRHAEQDGPTGALPLKVRSRFTSPHTPAKLPILFYRYPSSPGNDAEKCLLL